MISMVGLKASEDAMMILIHTSDHAMYAVEDPPQLDDLRAKWLLPPEYVYKQKMSQTYSKLK